MRATKVYMAPERVCRLPITSKVDVYSYSGVVILEMITGMSPFGVPNRENDGVAEPGRLVNWIRDQRGILQVKEGLGLKELSIQ